MALHPLSSPISEEVLTGNDVHVACHNGRGTRKRGKFSASGVATGPIPRHIHGTWHVESQKWIFLFILVRRVIYDQVR